MRKATDFHELILPKKHTGFLRVFLSNLSALNNIDKVILFGSCANGRCHPNSDIDLFIITKREPTIEEEVYIMADCPPDYENEYYLPSDIIINPYEQYEKHKNETGMVQKYVALEGIDLSGLLQKCAG